MDRNNTKKTVFGKIYLLDNLLWLESFYLKVYIKTQTHCCYVCKSIGSWEGGGSNTQDIELDS